MTSRRIGEWHDDQPIYAHMPLILGPGGGKLSDEIAFRPLLEHILGNTVTPWEWEGYTPSYIEAARKQQ